MASTTTVLSFAAVISLGAFIGATMPKGVPGRAVAPPAQVYPICGSGPRTNCVVDGDTAWIDGVKVRIADIDAPETHSSRCPYEEDLGGKATLRLAELMSAGSFEMKAADRDEDRYGRKLRVFVRDGHSLGDQLVTEGLARTWDGRRHPWC